MGRAECVQIPPITADVTISRRLQSIHEDDPHCRECIDGAVANIAVHNPPHHRRRQ